MQQISYKFFIGTLLFAPLAFGSVETWSIGIVEGLIFLTTFLYYFETRYKITCIAKSSRPAASLSFTCFLCGCN